MSNSKKVAVLGGGNFGTIIANMLAENEVTVTQWLRDPVRVEEIQTHRENRRYLPGYKLADSLKPSADLAATLEGAEVVFVSVPSHSFRKVIQQAKPYFKPQQMLVSCTKGVEVESFSLMSEIIKQELPNNPMAVLSGPNLAQEIIQRQLTATVVASEHEDLILGVQKLLHSDYFRVYASADVYGVELGGTLKNIYAIASGLGSAMGIGENTKSMLMTRSLAEMSRFAVSMGANPMTFIGLAGVGDLIVTCMSPLSRNYRVGYALGEGKQLDSIVAELGQAVEGINTLKQVKAKADELDIYMPLVNGLYEVVFNKAPVAAVIKTLMQNEQSMDVEFVLK